MRSITVHYYFTSPTVHNCQKILTSFTIFITYPIPIWSAHFQEMHEGLGNELVPCLHYLYDSDILTEEVILKWNDEVGEDQAIKSKVSVE